MQLQTMVVMNHLEDIPSRREYMRPEFARRKQQGDYYHIVRELECSDVEYFGKWTYVYKHWICEYDLNMYKY